MTFEEALKAKEEIGDLTTIRGIDYNVLVGPYDQLEFESWKQLYYDSHFGFHKIVFTDELAKIYSRNGQFKVYGNYQQGINLSIKELIS
jgi:hypothetical protein